MKIAVFVITVILSLFNLSTSFAQEIKSEQSQIEPPKEAILIDSYTTDIIDRKGKKIGSLLLRAGNEGVVMNIEVSGMQPGTHGMHFHDQAICTPEDEFKSAGAHIMPSKRPHGFFNPKGPHEGNLPNLIVSDEGRAEVELYTDLVRMRPCAKTDQAKACKKPALFSKSGSSLIIHENPDDHYTQPIGGSGGRSACAAIK